MFSWFYRIDTLSFWLGILLASLIWWILSLLRPAVRQVRSSILAKRAENKDKATSNINYEERYRASVLHKVQGLHLAASLFPLDEIVLPPSLLAPPPRVEPNAGVISEDIIDAAIPYLPAWPELATIYQASTLTLGQALSGNSDIILTGQPGTGKTVTLAYLASKLARRIPEPGLPPDMVPVYIHIADIDLPVKKEKPLNLIVELISENTPPHDRSRLPEFFLNCFSADRIILLIDGTDELTPDGMKNVVEFIKLIKRAYPKTRIITTASIDYLDGLVALNFVAFTLAAWNAKQRAAFVEKWGNLWIRKISLETWAKNSAQVDPLLINNWLNSQSSTLTPFELTLKTWGAYAGDILGPHPLDAIESHLLRLSSDNLPRESMEILALQTTVSGNSIFDHHIAREWLNSYELAEKENHSEDEDVSSPKPPNKTQLPSFGLILKLVENGLLSQHRNNRLRFMHPIICGYLAGKALAANNPVLLHDQPSWMGKSMGFHFFAAFGDAAPLVNDLLAINDSPLSRNLLGIARWLRDAPYQVTWRGQVQAKLVVLLKQTGQPLGLRGQALSALIQTGDPSISILFRQLIEDRDPETQQLAALGCGVQRDTKSIELLSSLMSNKSPNTRRAACLALVNIGTTEAMDMVGSALLHGDENIRRTAAEALANHPGEGHAMLKEGAGMKDDLLVRRSAAYGLGRIKALWAEELLAHFETDDDQWAVRTAAAEVNENRRKPDPHIPQRLPPPTESPWIIAFAGKQGVGVSPEKIPVDLLLLALKSGTEEERLASLPYLRLVPAEGVFGALYQAMYGGDSALREAAFLIFAEMAARGYNVPEPVQFGVGL